MFPVGFFPRARKTAGGTAESVRFAAKRRRRDSAFCPNDGRALSAALMPEANNSVTVVFTDIEDSVQLTERLGDEVWADLVDDHNDIVRASIARFAGFEVKATGDGFLIVFADPHSRAGERRRHSAAGDGACVAAAKLASPGGNWDPPGRSVVPARWRHFGTYGQHGPAHHGKERGAVKSGCRKLSRPRLRRHFVRPNGVITAGGVCGACQIGSTYMSSYGGLMKPGQRPGTLPQQSEVPGTVPGQMIVLTRGPH